MKGRLDIARRAINVFLFSMEAHAEKEPSSRTEQTSVVVCIKVYVVIKGKREWDMNVFLTGSQSIIIRSLSHFSAEYSCAFSIAVSIASTKGLK